MFREGDRSRSHWIRCPQFPWRKLVVFCWFPLSTRGALKLYIQHVDFKVCIIRTFLFFEDLKNISIYVRTYIANIIYNLRFIFLLIVQAVRFFGCQNILYNGLTQINSPRNHISIFGCTNATLSNLHLIAPANSPNTDGIDISHSQNIHVLSSTIKTGITIFLS